MQETRFPCPHCSTPLRIRDQRFLGQTIPCPDCSQPLRIVLNNVGEFSAEKGGELPPPPAPEEPPSETSAEQPNPKPKRRRKKTTAETSQVTPEPANESGGQEQQENLRGPSQLATLLKNPITIAWILGTAATILLVVAIWPDHSGAPDENSSPVNSSAIVQQPPELQRPAKTPEPYPLQKTPESRMEQLGERLLSYHETHGHFPQGIVSENGLPLEQRFSWLAEIVSQSKLGSHSRSNLHGWDASENERFVRHSYSQFLNPRVFPLTGTRGYPATHFVGMAGVGADAYTLPKTDSRAGIFGVNRQTTLADITDGPANTILLAGVQKQLGSWASPGHATMRAFTAEPYVNGPDGFGTGSPDRMFVLMADGSIREVSDKTHPEIMRRMASMADGHSLEINTPEIPIPSPLKREPVIAQRPALPEIVPEPPQIPAPEVKKVDVAKALAQPIRSYVLTEAVPAKDILFQLEEMAGIPLRVKEGIPQETLSKNVILSLEQTTVGGILKALTGELNLDIEVQPDGIRLIERGAATATSGSEAEGASL